MAWPGLAWRRLCCMGCAHRADQRDRCGMTHARHREFGLDQHIHLSLSLSLFHSLASRRYAAITTLHRSTQASDTDCLFSDCYRVYSWLR
jgi:hypothetical protein